MTNSIEKAKSIIKNNISLIENYTRHDNTELAVFLSIEKRINQLHDFIKQNTPPKELRKKVARLRKFVKRISNGELKNTDKRFQRFSKLITIYKIDNHFVQKEHNVWEFTNEHFTAQYTIGKNGHVYKRLLKKYNYRPYFGKWEETKSTEISDNFKKECKSLYINHRA